MDAMLDRRTWEAYSINCTEALDNIYRNGSQTCHPKGKTYKDAQLRELVYSIAVEHALEHKVDYGSEPAREKRREDKTAAER
jgi:hypothetical protein